MISEFYLNMDFLNQISVTDNFDLTKRQDFAAAFTQVYEIVGNAQAKENEYELDFFYQKRYVVFQRRATGNILEFYEIRFYGP